MKSAILLGYLFPILFYAAGDLSYASNAKEHNVMALHQELCAKEYDPVKRYNYCHLFENKDKSNTDALLHEFRKDIALV